MRRDQRSDVTTDSRADMSDVTLFEILISLNYQRITVYIFKFSLQSMKAIRLNNTFARISGSPLVDASCGWNQVLN